MPASAHPVSAQEQERARRAGGGAQPSLLRAIVGAYGRPYLWLGLLKLAGDALNFAGPLLLNLLLRHLAAAPAHGAVSAGGGQRRLLGWTPDVAAPAFGYACAAALAGSLVLKVCWAGTGVLGPCLLEGGGLPMWGEAEMYFAVARSPPWHKMPTSQHGSVACDGCPSRALNAPE